MFSRPTRISHGGRTPAPHTFIIAFTASWLGLRMRERRGKFLPNSACSDCASKCTSTSVHGTQKAWAGGSAAEAAAALPASAPGIASSSPPTKSV